MGFMIPCCVCGTMLTSFVQKKAFKITRQVKFNYKGEVTLDQELDFERPVCDSCVARMEGEGHIFDAKTGVVVKHYAEDGKSALVPTPDIAIPERSKPLIQTTPPTPRLGFKDVQIAYMIDGVAGVEKLINDKKASKSAVRRALKEFSKAGREVAPLEKWVVENVGPVGRGRKTPSHGDVRTYRAQQIQAGGPFIRLPLDALGVSKGNSVRVAFEQGRIVVEAV